MAQVPPDSPPELHYPTLKFVIDLLTEDINTVIQEEDDTKELTLRRFRDKIRDIISSIRGTS